jgi:hypothetical protein
MLRIRSRFISGLIILQFFLLTPVLAESDPPRFGDVSILLYRLLDLMYAFGGVIFMALLVFIGFQWMSSGGNEEAIGAARQRLLYWVLGFILYFFSATIVTSIYTTLEVKDCTGETRTPGLSIFYENSCPEPTYYISYKEKNPSIEPSGEICSYGNRDEQVLMKQRNDGIISSYQVYSAFDSNDARGSLQRCCAGKPPGVQNCPAP